MSDQEATGTGGMSGFSFADIDNENQNYGGAEVSMEQPEPFDGDTMAGGMTSIAIPTESRMECAAPATHSAPEGEYSPASRISELGIPSNVSQANEAGCISVGSNRGTGLSTLLALAGDLNEFVTKNDQGEYELLLLAHMTDWAANENASSHKLQLFVGQYDREGFLDAGVEQFLIDLDSFNDKMPANGVKLEFDATVDECNVTTQTGTFALDISIADGLDIKLSLMSTTIRGQVTGDATGFSLSDTTISGYLSGEDVTNLVNGLKAACEADDPPSLCSAVAPILLADDAVEKVVGLMKGYDTKLVDGNPMECDKKAEARAANSCNAVSVCLQISSESVSISGLSAD